jgi:hypothetical protein
VVSDVGVGGASTNAAATGDGALLFLLVRVLLISNMLNFHSSFLSECCS